MDLRVTDFHLTSHSLWASFNHGFFAVGGHTVEGNQILRILTQYLPRTGFQMQGNSLSFDLAKQCPRAIDTREKMQKALDRYAHTKVKLTLDKTLVRACNPPQEVKSERQWRKLEDDTDLHLINARVRVNASLLVTHSDTDHVEKLVSTPVFSYWQDQKGFFFDIAFEGPLQGQNPWRYAERLLPKIKAAVPWAC